MHTRHETWLSLKYHLVNLHTLCHLSDKILDFSLKNSHVGSDIFSNYASVQDVLCVRVGYLPFSGSKNGLYTAEALLHWINGSLQLQGDWMIALILDKVSGYWHHILSLNISIFWGNYNMPLSKQCQVTFSHFLIWKTCICGLGGTLLWFSAFAFLTTHQQMKDMNNHFYRWLWTYRDCYAAIHVRPYLLCQ